MEIRFRCKSIILKKASFYAGLLSILFPMLTILNNPSLSQKKDLEIYKNKVNEGKQLYESSRFSEAIVVIKEIIPAIESLEEDQEKKDLLAEAYFYLGSSFIAQNNLDEAESAFINLLKANESYADRITMDIWGPKILNILNIARTKWAEEKKKKELEKKFVNKPKELAILEISAWPQAQIELDGKPKGTVPPVLKELVEEGEHKIKFKIENKKYGKYDEKIQDIIVRKGEPNKVSVKFEPFGALEVISNDAWEYDVHINNQLLGKTPIRKLIKSGPHSLSIQYSNYQKKFNIFINDFKINLFKVTLARNKIQIKKELKDN